MSNRKPNLTDKELALLTQITLDNPGGKAVTILSKFNNENAGRHIKLSTVQKKLAEWRKPGEDGTPAKIPPANASLAKSGRPLGLEAPWSLGCVAQNDLPAEVIPLLLDICEEQRHIHRTYHGGPLTIRQAFWISKLRCVIQPPRVTVRFFKNTTISLLYDWAFEYARKQQISEITTGPFDTSILDIMITSYPEQCALFCLYLDTDIVKTQDKIRELAQQIDVYIDTMNSLYKLNNKYKSVSQNYSEEDRTLFKLAMKRLKDFRRTYFPEKRIVLEQVLGHALAPDRVQSDLQYTEDDMITAEDHLELGWEFKCRECRSIAVDQFSRAIRLDPNRIDSYLDRGEALEELGEFSLAIQDYDQAIRLDPSCVDAYEGRAYSYTWLKNNIKAQQDINKAIEITQRNIDAALAKGDDFEYEQERLEELRDHVGKRLDRNGEWI